MIKRISGIIITTLLTTSLFGKGVDVGKENIILNFLNSSIKKDLIIEDISIDYSKRFENGWNGYIVSLKFKGKKEAVKDIFFTDGTYVTNSLIETNSKKDLKIEMIENSFKKIDDKFYNKDTFIYGNGDAKNKLMIISDPLCPICINYFQALYRFLGENKVDVGVYYLNYPLERLHPTSLFVSSYLKGLKKVGIKDVYKNWYLKSSQYIKDASFYKNRDKILSVLKKVFSEDVIKDIDYEKYKKEIKRLKAELAEFDIRGTPTVYFNGKIDIKKTKVFNLNKRDD